MIVVREESESDLDGIREVNRAAFAADGEGALVDRLRADGLVFVSVVATVDDMLAGHALFSRLDVAVQGAEIPAAALAPVAVRPAFQRQGIGTRMIEFGLQRCAEAGIAAVIVLGDPAYYERFGFAVETAACLRSPYAGPHFMGFELRSGALAGRAGVVTYPSAFSLVN